MSTPMGQSVRIALARVWQATWGLPQTLVGGTMCLALRHSTSRSSYRSAIVSEWKLASGLSLGMFIFVPRGCPRPLLRHEYGHSIQSMILGPFYLPLIVLPSLVWAGTPRLEHYRSSHKYSYYRFYTERWANVLSHKVTGKTPEGWYERKHK